MTGRVYGWQGYLLRHGSCPLNCLASNSGLRWQSWMLACRNKGQNNRNVSVRPTCCRHVGRHVGDTTQKAVDRETGPTCHSMSLADMLAKCWQHGKYLAVEFEPMSMLLWLDSPATLPVRTRVLICRVAGISRNMSAA
jgi:hypothetical protein